MFGEVEDAEKVGSSNGTTKMTDQDIAEGYEQCANPNRCIVKK